MNKSIDYNNISKNYSIHRNASLTVVNHILKLLREKEIKNILELGCGTADYLFSLNQNIKANSYGFDNSEGMILEGKIKNPRLNLNINDLHNKFNYNNNFFDFIYSIDVIHYIKNLDHYFNECFRVLNKDGIIITITDSEEDLQNRTMTKYFSESLEIEKKRYPKIETIIKSMEKSGFIDLEITHTEKEYNFDDKAYQKYVNKAYSAIRLVSEKCYKVGINNIKDDMRNNKAKIKELYTYIKGRKIAASSFT